MSTCLEDIKIENRDVCVAANLGGLGDILPAFNAGPALSPRDLRTSVSENAKARLIRAAEEVLTSNWAPLTASLYRTYTQTGDRVAFENLYFDRRRRINHLALAELVEAKGRFVDALIEGLWLVLDESGWQLPAHNAHERGGPRAPLPDPANPIIDLFAAETGAQLAVIAKMLGDVLQEVDPAIVPRIDSEISQRITRPYLEKHFWWMGNGDEPMNNWTAWCTQNVLLSTFTRPTDQATRHAVIAKAAHSLDAFLKDYGDDGACEEGALYYRHAALCMSGALQIMDAVAPGVFSHLWDEPKIRNMAEYLVHAHVAGHYYVNFADASAVLPPCSAREFLFGKKVGSDALCTLAARDAKADENPELPDEINLFYRLLALTTADEMAAWQTGEIKKPDIYYPSCGLFIVRDDAFVLAVKAGNNDDSHNHNDVGSFTLFKNGKPLLIDIGVETYTAKTFSADRYDIWTMQSAWHNLPTFDGVQQQAGAGFAAQHVDVKLDTTCPEIRMDIAGAYPEEAKLSSYLRTARLIKGEAVEISDRFEGEKPAELSLMVQEKPVATPQGLQVGDLATIVITGGATPRIEPVPVADARLRWAWPKTIYRVLIPIADRNFTLRIV